MAEEKKDSKSKVIIIVLIIVIVLLAGGGVAAIMLFSSGNGQNTPANTESTTAVTTTVANDKNPLVLDYEEGAVALDENGLERQIEEMKNSSGNVSLEYKNEAESSDGTNFVCYLANSDLNTEDMFVAIFKDATLTEQVYLSGLLRPGTAIQNFVSEIKYAPGVYSAVALFTSVGDDHETMTSQIAVELKFTVN